MVPDGLKFTKEHEWVKVEGDIATMGITDYAQGELGDVVFVELPKIGSEVKQLEPMGTIEAVKAVNDIFSPVSGQVVEVNGALSNRPELANKDPYGEGWFVKIRLSNPSEIDNLLSPADYKTLIGQ